MNDSAHGLSLVGCRVHRHFFPIVHMHAKKVNCPFGCMTYVYRNP
jgi:hypothetical protein